MVQLEISCTHALTNVFADNNILQKTEKKPLVFWFIRCNVIFSDNLVIRCGNCFVLKCLRLV